MLFKANEWRNSQLNSVIGNFHAQMWIEFCLKRESKWLRITLFRSKDWKRKGEGVLSLFFVFYCIFLFFLLWFFRLKNLWHLLSSYLKGILLVAELPNNLSPQIIWVTMQSKTENRMSDYILDLRTFWFSFEKLVLTIIGFG